MKEEILNIWRSRTFQFGMDICRTLLIVIAILIFYKLTTEIEAVKILNSDPCEICMNKTGATCFIGNEQSYERIVYPVINISSYLYNITNKS